MDPTWSKPVWSHASWNEFITKYVGKIKPKPEFAVFQGGQFGYSFDPEVETSVDWLLFAQTQIGMKSFWKTAHYNRTHMLSEKEQKLDTFMCKKLGCLDISWTQNVADKLYWDSQHFFEPVYRVMNEEMLEKLGYLPEKYEGYNKYNLLD